jgi:hypothetical protein
MGFVAPLFFILFFSCLPAKEAKKPKRRNVETAVAAVIWRAVERYPPPQIKETKKKLMIFFFFFFFDLVPAALPPPKHSECQQQRNGFDVKHLVVLVCCPVFFSDWVGRSPHVNGHNDSKIPNQFPGLRQEFTELWDGEEKEENFE